MEYSLNKLTWNNIDWILIEKKVLKIQRRIYKAKIENKINVIHYLQNQLINSVYAKLLAVREIISINKGKKINNKELIVNLKKWQLLNSLKHNVKLDLINAIYISELDNYQFLKVINIKDSIKQILIKLALEAE